MLGNDACGDESAARGGESPVLWEPESARLLFPVTAASAKAAAGTWSLCIMTSTSSGFTRESVIVSAAWSSTAGMWSSVCRICDGMLWLSSGASDIGSCTSRSKIWEVAGERCRGEAVAVLMPERRPARLGGEFGPPRSKGEPLR
jgi:hypothetical protein